MTEGTLSLSDGSEEWPSWGTVAVVMETLFGAATDRMFAVSSTSMKPARVHGVVGIEL